MTPQAKLDGLLRGTRQPRTQEPGLPYYTVLVQKPKAEPLCGCGHSKHSGQCGSAETFTGYPCVCRRTA